MLKEFTDAWVLNMQRIKQDVEKLYKDKSGAIRYKDLVEALIDNIGVYSNLTELDFGDYQGTLIYIFTDNCYQPSTTETYYTSIYYGSCSACDTLKAILEEDSEEDVINDLMSVILSLVQNVNVMKEQ